MNAENCMALKRIPLHRLGPSCPQTNGASPIQLHAHLFINLNQPSCRSNVAVVAHGGKHVEGEKNRERDAAKSVQDAPTDVLKKKKYVHVRHGKAEVIKK